MRRLLSLFIAAVALFGTAALTGSAAEQRARALFNCSEGRATCAEPLDSIGEYGAVHRPRRAVAALLLEHARLGELEPVPPAAAEATRDACRSRTATAAPGTSSSTRPSGSGWRCATTSPARSSRTLRARPDSDTNIFDGTNPADPDYIGKHPGTAFMELQFYPPGWVPLAARRQLRRDEVVRGAGHLQPQPGPEHAACSTTPTASAASASSRPTSRSSRGAARPHAPPGPLGATRRDVHAEPGDRPVHELGRRLDGRHPRHRGRAHAIDPRPDDRPDRLDDGQRRERVRPDQVRPDAATCHQTPYTFHPMYATSSEHTRVPWAAHSYNVAFSDEIGHFEYCNAVDRQGGDCTSQRRGRARRRRQPPASAPAHSLLVQIGGCIGTDDDFDGVSLPEDLAGDRNEPGQDRPSTRLDLVHEPALQRQPELQPGRVRGRPAAHRGARLRRQLRPLTGADCVNPPPGVELLSVLLDREELDDGNPARARTVTASGSSAAPNIPGTTNTFGGNSAAEFGPLLFSFYPNPNPAVRLRTNNFRNVLESNPCPA